MNITQYLGDLMGRLLDVEFYLKSVPDSLMDPEDKIECGLLLQWCKTYQQSVAIITQSLRSSDLKSPTAAADCAELLSVIEEFLDDMESSHPDIRMQNFTPVLLEELEKSE